MKKIFGTIAILGLVAAVTPASAQWHRHGGGWHGGWHRGGGVGLGLATGLIVGGAIASANNSGDREDYCAQRFRSYDPDSGTYLGNDGRRHVC